MRTYFEEEKYKLILGDCIDVMKSLPEKSVDMIFADPPYFLSSDGITCSSGKMVSVNKGAWDTGRSIEKIHDFNMAWIKECKRILKDDGTIWISGTQHNIYSIGFSLQKLNYKILNSIVWYKRNAPPNLSCRYFTHSTEIIIWAKKMKGKHTFNYEIMKNSNNSKQMRDVWLDICGEYGESEINSDLWILPAINKKEKQYGYFPTQKPIKLLERIVLSCTDEGQLIMDPFNGSGTTGIVAISTNRKFIGIDINEEYLELSKTRYMNLEQRIQFGSNPL